MWLHRFRRLLFGPGRTSPAHRSKSPVRRGRIELLLERLEDRTLPAILNVAAGDVTGLITAFGSAASGDTIALASNST